MEQLAVWYCLLYCSQAILPLVFFPTNEDWLSNPDTMRVDSPLYTVFVYGALLLSTLLIGSRMQAVWNVLCANRMLVLFLFFMAFSSIWALKPLASLYVVLKTLWAIMFGLFLAVRFPHREQSFLLKVFFGALVLCSLYFSVVLPHLGRHITGAWRGVYGDRNFFALVMNVAVITLLCASYRNIASRWAAWCIAMLAIGLIILSGSATGAICLIAIALTAFVAPLLRLHWPVMSVLLVTGIITTTLAWTLAEPDLTMADIAGWFGKTGDFSGRSEIWAAFWQKLYDGGHLLIGYGAQDIYITTNGYLVTEYLTSLFSEGDRAMAPHNLFLALLMHYGVIGILLAGGVVAGAFFQVARQAILGVPMQYWALLIMLTITVFGFTLTLDNTPLLWALFALVLGNASWRGRESGAIR